MPSLHFYEMEFSGNLSLQEQAEFLRILDKISKETAPFVVLTQSEGDSPLIPENKKRMNLWFKDNRDFLGKMCLGIVRVKPGFADDHYEGSNMQKGMPFPIHARGDKTAGFELAKKILNRHLSDSSDK